MADRYALVGRQVETAAIDDLLGGTATGLGGALVLVGEAGMGKTALLDHAARQSGRIRLLRTEGVEPERDLPFAGLHRLLLPVVDSLQALPPSQAASMRAALGLAPGNGERFLVGAGLLSLLADVAGDSGVLCLVDNAQWLDVESADALAFAARRLGAESIVMLFAARSTGTSSLPGIPTLSLSGLSAPDAIGLLRARHGLAGSVIDRVVDSSEGNPQALLEIPAAMTPGQRAGSEALPAELPLGERIQTAMMLRVADLPDPARQLLLLAAVDPAAELAILSAAAASMGLELGELEPAERAGLVTTRAGQVRFRSPLLRSAIYADATFLQRDAAHAVLAEVLHGSQPDRWAWHKAAITQGTDPVLAGELERSAERSRSRAGHAATAAALERAAELTADGPHRARRLVAATTAAWAAGQADRAERLASQAEELELTGSLRGRISMVRGLIQTHRGRPSAGLQLLHSAAEDLAVDDVELSMTALTAAVEAAMVIGDFTSLPRMADLATTIAEGRPAAASGLLTGLAQMVQGDSSAGTTSLRAFVDHADPSDEPRVLGCRAAAANFLGEERTALRLYGAAISIARATGAISSLSWLLEQRALTEATNGQLLTAEADASEGIGLVEELGTELPPLVGLAALTWVSAMRGNDDKAHLSAERVLVEAQQHGLSLPIGLVTAAMMELDLARGRIESATARARELGRSAEHMHPMVTIITTPVRLEILLRAGDPPPTADLAAHRAWAHHSRNGANRAIALRCDALLADRDSAAALFDEALRVHEATNRPFDQARTRLLYGEFLRRHRQPLRARGHLRDAGEQFARLGCQAWAARARAELRAAGESSVEPSGDVFAELTPQELQIVRLVSEGQSNRQVAEQLFLSPRTVEYHLYKVYPKLGIGSRTDLVRRWAEQLAGSSSA